MPALYYVGRPGISPALAALIADGSVGPRDRILDVGCGTGTDVLTLARWGFRHVHGVDPDARAVRSARARATRARLGGRATFHHLGAERLSEAFGADQFDLLLHTLVANNLTENRDAHFREMARVLRPEGRILLHERVTKRYENSAPGRFGLMPEANRYFRMGRGVATHLAEEPAGRRGPSYARVVLWVGRPR